VAEERRTTNEPEAGDADAREARHAFGGAANLMLHPMAGLTAMTALSFGMASHAMGLWAGAVAGAMDTQRRLMGEAAPAPKPARRAEPRPAGRPKRGHLSLVASSDLPAAMPEAAVKPAAGDTPRRSGVADDLKAISGIGPKLEKVLNDLGIGTYADVAALSAERVDELDAELGIGARIRRDDWIGQARRLGGIGEP
jgi:NADH-quinone oxidoreductase subunit E